MAQLPTNLSLLMNNRLQVVMGLLGDYWGIADSLLSLIGSNTLTGILLIERLETATQVRAQLAATIGGGNNADLRAEMALQLSIVDITGDIGAGNAASAAMLTSMSDLIAAMPKPVDANDTDGRVDTIATGTGALQTACNDLKAAIANPST